MGGPLAGLQVLDLSRNVAGPYATKLLADYGARVIKVEPRGGDPSRRFGPFPGNAPDIEGSGLFLHLNTNKLSIVLDPHTDDGATAVRRLARQVDVIVEDGMPGEAAAAGWGWEVLHALNPRLVLCSITAFGQSGPYRDYRGSELTLQAIGGPLHATGAADREPLKLAGHYAGYHAGATAALAILLALRRSERNRQSGEWRRSGEWIDISIYRCQAGCRDRRTVQLTAAAYSGVSPQRARRDSRWVGAGIFPCADGYVNVMGAGRRMPVLLKWIGREDLLEESRAAAGVVPGFADRLNEAITEFLTGMGKVEAVAAAQSSGLLAGALMTVADLLKDPQLAARDWWHEITHWHGTELKYPGFPFRMYGSPPEQPLRAPHLGEHARAVLDLAPIEVDPPRDLVQGDLPLPLEGVRVAAITVVWAGPHVTQLLAEWGADVIQVEPVNRMQPFTRGAENVPTRKQMLRGAARGVQPQYPDADPGAEPWNRSASFNSHARNKRSMTCDIMSAEGRAAFLKLIERCDVLVENNVPQTIDRAGIGWDELQAVNPRLIMLRMPAFGLEGPYSSYRAFGLHVEAMVGHTHLRGYPDTRPGGTGETLASDGLAGVQGAVAVLMALRHRERTGEGQLIEMPLNEGFVPTLAEFLFEHTMNHVNPPPQANRHRWNAPHNVYRCLGDDQWIAIDVETDAQFLALCNALSGGRGGTGDVDIGHAPQDARFATARLRLQHVETLDQLVGAATASWDKQELFHALQAAGVCAAPVNDPLEALSDPHLRAVGFFEEQTIEGVGTHDYPGLTIQMRRTPNQLRTPPPRLGEHNEEIYGGLLGYSSEQLAELERKGLVGTAYPPELLPEHLRGAAAPERRS